MIQNLSWSLLPTEFQGSVTLCWWGNGTVEDSHGLISEEPQLGCCTASMYYFPSCGSKLQSLECIISFHFHSMVDLTSVFLLSSSKFKESTTISYLKTCLHLHLSHICSSLDLQSVYNSLLHLFLTSVSPEVLLLPLLMEPQSSVH